MYYIQATYPDYSRKILYITFKDANNHHIYAERIRVIGLSR